MSRTQMADAQSQHLVIATYASHVEAAAALHQLRSCGFDMKKWSILGKDVLAQEGSFGFYSSGNHMKFWAGRGDVWADVWSILLGGGFFFIPPIGPLVVMGPLATWIVDALETAAAGEESLAPGIVLMRVGLPSDRVERYELDVRSGNYLVLALGSALLAESARVVLSATSASQLYTVRAPQDHAQRSIAERSSHPNMIEQ
ncbi:MAG: permease [Kofleriaceae bacterium]